MAKKFIVVTAGRKPGVYRGWPEAAPHVLGVPKAVWMGYDSETEAYGAFGKATMAGKRRVLEADGFDKTPSQSSARVKAPERRPQTVSAQNDTKAGVRRDASVEEIVIQCPALSSSRPRSTIQRASTLPPQHPPRSLNKAVQRSKTAPELDPHSTPSTPRKRAREQTLSVGRSRAISISTDRSTTDEEAIPPSPATNVSSTLSPTFGHLSLPPSRNVTPSRPSPARGRDKDDGYQNSHRLATARSARGVKSPGHTGAGPPFKRVTNTAGGSAHCTTQPGTSRRHQSPKKVVWDPSPPTNRLPSREDLYRTASRTMRDRSRGSPPASPGGSSQLTYVSDDEHPAGGLVQSTDDSDYHTPLLRDSEVSDVESELLERVSSSTLKRKGKHRESPPPPSPFPRSSSPSSLAGSSPGGFNSVTARSHKKRRDRRARRPSSQDSANYQEAREKTPAQDFNQSPFQGFCQCAGPCPSCHKSRVPFPPYYHPSMFYPIPYPYPYFLPPHMHQLSQYGPPPHPYPNAISQQTDLLPSISSAQPIPLSSGYTIYPPPATHPPITHSAGVPACDSPAPVPVPTPSTPAPKPSIITSSRPTTPSPSVHVGSPPVDPPTTEQVSPEIFNSLGQFSQPPRSPVKIIDPSCDPRSPYSKMAAVPTFLNSTITLGRPRTPLSPLDGLGLAL
ncbi:hypothetical protein BJ322DRAFT_1064209 [Thelephora terrestris]|uniref:Ribonuclease H1 N-terminal domain-containing protein n=1 Tax=Thelephora terrestris TaxID=56493 RepID=A0A9P6HCU0_9AGAM|nr:hypothetical protein BJ322DRAFT_1064209 [Thelephora terrestris]